jgi:hypothetical protein
MTLHILAHGCKVNPLNGLKQEQRAWNSPIPHQQRRLGWNRGAEYFPTTVQQQNHCSVRCCPVKPPQYPIHTNPRLGRTCERRGGTKSQIGYRWISVHAHSGLRTRRIGGRQVRFIVWRKPVSREMDDHATRLHQALTKTIECGDKLGPTWVSQQCNIISALLQKLRHVVCILSTLSQGPQP